MYGKDHIRAKDDENDEDVAPASTRVTIADSDSSPVKATAVEMSEVNH